jgi:hypothetical protein
MRIESAARAHADPGVPAKRRPAKVPPVRPCAGSCRYGDGRMPFAGADDFGNGAKSANLGREIHAADETLEARIGAQAIECRPHLQQGQKVVMLAVAAL